MSDEGGFPLMPILDLDVVVTPADIKLGEDFGPLELVYKVRDEGKRVGIPNSVFSQVVIVLTGAETAILLFDEEEGCGLGGI